MRLAFFIKLIKRKFEKPSLEYAPKGWSTKLKNKNGWNDTSIIEYKKKEFANNCCQENLFYTRVLLTLPKKPTLSILDWGGGFGYYYQRTRAILPTVAINFHCKEVPLMVETGKRINPDVHWYANNSCLKRTYDLVIISGTLQCIKDWKNTLRKITTAVGNYLLLTRLPVIKHNSGFVAIHRYCNSEMFHYQINEEKILEAFRKNGLKIVMESVVEPSTNIKNAPEQFEMKGWLLKK